MKRKFTLREQTHGELACRALSDVAREVLSTTDPLTIYEVEKDDGMRRYYARGVMEIDSVSLSELDDILKSYAE